MREQPLSSYLRGRGWLNRVIAIAHLLSLGLRRMAWLNIAIQTAFPLMVAFTPVMTRAGEQHFLQQPAPLFTQYTPKSPSVEDDTLPFSGIMSEGASMLASGRATDSARALAVGESSATLQQWLSSFGTARIQLNMDRNGSWSHSSGDLLVPLYDNGQSVMFVQGGIRKPSDRLTGNLGYGVRTFWQKGWMFGGNVFYDNDFTGHNHRVGIGSEVWRNYLRLSANTYLGTTDWHTSRDFEGIWQEKPADGYDIRAEGWLPAYPQLGGKLEWEQYYGQQVALFDKDHLQHNPHAVAAGVEYTPLPLLTLRAEQRQARGLHDTQVALDVNWNFGQDWRWQLDPENVQAMRTMAGSRYELVNRNNEIVLQYRKNPSQEVAHLLLTLVTDNSPADGLTRNVLQVLATNRNGQPVPDAIVNWMVPSSDASVSLAAASSVTDQNGQSSVTLTSKKVQAVPVTAQSNSVSATQNSHFVAVAVSKITLDVTRDNAVADGNSTDTVVATMTDGNGRAAAGQEVTWTLPDGVSMKEASSVSDSRGEATVHLMSSAAGSATVSAAAGNQTAEGAVHFTGNNATAKIGNLTVTTDGSTADGKTADVAQITVTDANGNPLYGQAITWKADKSTVVFGQSAVTDRSGKTTITYTDTTAESLTLTATLASGRSATVPSLFVSDKNRARLKNLTVTSGAMASGNDTNTATVTVTDPYGNPLANNAVIFSVTGSAKIADATVNTGSNGQAQVTLTDTVAETVLVTAKLASSSSSLTKESRFAADLNNAVLTVTATTGALADGSATNMAKVTLKDKNGRALAGKAVTLNADGSAKLSATSGVTDSSGQLRVTLTDTAAETITVTAALTNGKKSSAQMAFITYAVTTLSASATSVKADGSASSTLTATVKDSSGAVVANTPVAFVVTGSATLNTTTASTNSSGQAQVTLTDAVGESVTVTAKAENNSRDSGKAQNVTFVALSITGAAAFGTTHIFLTGQGFPQTGFAGAKLYFLIDGSDENDETYTWSSNQSWVTVANGEATMNANASSSTLDDSPPSSARQVTITATPKKGGAALTYTFTLQKWYARSPVRAHVEIGGGDEASGACGDIGTIESASDMSDGAVSVVGKLFGEWRDSSTLAAAFFWDTETTTTWRAAKKPGDYIAFIYSTGVPSSAPFPGSTYAMCRIN